MSFRVADSARLLIGRRSTLLAVIKVKRITLKLSPNDASLRNRLMNYIFSRYFYLIMQSDRKVDRLLPVQFLSVVKFLRDLHEIPQMFGFLVSQSLLIVSYGAMSDYVNDMQSSPAWSEQR